MQSILLTYSKDLLHTLAVVDEKELAVVDEKEYKYAGKYLIQFFFLF